MVLLAHVIIALSSIIFSTWLLFRPSRIKYIIDVVLIVSTLISGTYLVVISHSPLLPSCEAGLTYLLVVSILIYFSYRRFSKDLVQQTVRVKKD